MSNSKWVKFDPANIDNIECGTYYAYGGIAEDGNPAFTSGEVGILTVFNISNGKLACCDGKFIFDLAYMPLFIAPFDLEALTADIPNLD